MSGLLWRYYLEDDVDTFRQLLQEAAVANRGQGQRGYIGGLHGGATAGASSSAFTIGSPGGNAVSPSASYDSRKAYGVRGSVDTYKTSFHDVTLTRADINRRDGKGMTLLHYAASGTHENALGFALALLAHPLVELYAQDFESGWTALHRAFYFGSITIARAILEREAQDAVGHGSGGTIAHSALSLIKMKDREGNGPYDLLTATIKDRTLQHHDPSARHPFHAGREDSEDEDNDSTANDNEDGSSRKAMVTPIVDVDADEFLTFGSNKNITLGLGNHDDRQFPERVVLRKPDHLYKRFFREYTEYRAAETEGAAPAYAEKIRSKLRHARAIEELPSVVRFRHDKVHDVQMSKLHTAVLTNDPVSNLYICGHGHGGRLGTGDQRTQFSFVCIEGFGPNRKKIVAVALGQDHSLAVSDQGEVFSWGSNSFGQLGLGPPKISVNPEDNVELLPKQIFGPLKRELVIGVAASRIHSVAHTSTALFTWGKNEGQLGVVDAHAGSLEMQAIPRRIAASRFSCAIQSVCAIDRATICLLENHEVHVFANYGIVKVVFPLDAPGNSFIKKSFLATRYDDRPNCIIKITGGGDTICALSSAGEVFSLTVDQRLDPGSSSTMSTTNPNKIKAALSAPTRVWSLKKGHMTAKDVGVDADGSIILSTNSGSVWRRVRRPGLPSGRVATAGEQKSKEFKFSRVPGLTRVVAVRASAFGAYCALRSECNVTRDQLIPANKSWWHATYALLPFKHLARDEDSDTENPAPRFWSRKPYALELLVACLADSKDLEKDIEAVLRNSPNEHSENYDGFICTTASDIKVPVHLFMLASRSRTLRQLLTEINRTCRWESELFTISSDKDGRTLITFNGLDFLTIVELVLYVYADAFVGFWLRSRHAPHLAYRYRQVRTELMKVASRLELRNLESAARRMSPTAEFSLDKDMELAIADPGYFQDGNARIELADGEVVIHTDLLSRRCPFFEGLFQGRAGGRWLNERRDLLASRDEAIGIDMTHVEFSVFQLVLRHIYADTGEELFDDIVTKDLDQFLDVVLEVLSVANELMLDRLSQICQMVLGRYVNARNACQLLNAVAPSAITDFKDAALEYLCLNLEGMLSSHLLDELDEDLLHELDAVVRDNQLASLPFAKSGRAEAVLHEKYPELAMQMDRARRAKLDSISFQVKFADPGTSFGTSYDLTYEEDTFSTSARPKARTRPSAVSTAPQTPSMKPIFPESDLSSSIGGSGQSHRPSLSALVQQRSTPSGVVSPSPEPSPSGPRPQMARSPSGRVFPMLPPPAEEEEKGTSLPRARLPEIADNTKDNARSSTVRPWGVAPLASGKLSMKEIMEQATTRTSNISLGLASQEGIIEDQSPGSFNARASQKERKRQQQLHQDEVSPGFRTSPSTPWQTVGAKAPPPRNGVEVHSNSTPSPQIATSDIQRGISTPQLTMRQTVANAPAAVKTRELSTPHKKAPVSPIQQRSTSTPQASRPSPIQTTPSNSATKAMEIQSIRHTPRPPTGVSPTFYMHHSMADIFSQQQAEKVEKKEAVAKRSLAEIQQEQEFLSWWDQERKRVMEEEAKATSRPAAERSKGRGPGRGRGGAGKGKSSGGGRGRGTGSASAGANAGASAVRRGGKDRSSSSAATMQSPAAPSSEPAA